MCWRATTPQARSWHLSIRHRVFVEEQRIIPLTDVDDRDRDAGTVHVLGGRGSAALGTVRLYRHDPDGSAAAAAGAEASAGLGAAANSAGTASAAVGAAGAAGTAAGAAGDTRRWKGDRLAVLRGHATALVGARLVYFAVSWAAAAGGEVMDAQVQMQNVRFFERLGWSRNGEPAQYYGLAHQPMIFRLADAGRLKSFSGPRDARLELPAPRDAPSPLLSRAFPKAI